MRDGLRRLVRRYLEVTARYLRAWDPERAARPAPVARDVAAPIDLREAEPGDDETVVELDDEVIQLDDPARREQ